MNATVRPLAQKSPGKLCGQAPNLLVCCGWKVSYNGKFSLDQPNGPSEGALNPAHGSLLCISSPSRIGLMMRYPSLMVLPPFSLVCLSYPPFFQPPLSPFQSIFINFPYWVCHDDRCDFLCWWDLFAICSWSSGSYLLGQMWLCWNLFLLSFGSRQVISPKVL